MSKGPKTLTTRQETRLDPTQQGRQDLIWNEAMGLAGQDYNPYTGQRFQEFTPDQLAAFAQARGAADAGQGLLGRGAENIQQILAGLGQYSGPEFETQRRTQLDRFQIDPSGLPQVGVGPARDVQAGTARDVGAGAGPGGYRAYMDPFQSQVVDTTLSGIERARQEAANATRSQAAQAGAFGGSRSGVAESLTNRDFGETAARTLAHLNSQGFSQALGFNRADQDRALQASLANQGKDISMAGQHLQAGMANQGADLTRSGQGVQAGIANQRSALDALLGNQRAGADFDARSGSLGLQAAGLGLQGAGALAGLGQQQQQMQAFGADLLSRVGGQQQALGQAARDFDFDQWQQQQNHPYRQLGILQDVLGRQHFGGTTISVDPNLNRGSLGGTLGALAGTALGGPFGGAFGNWAGGLLNGRGVNAA